MTFQPVTESALLIVFSLGNFADWVYYSGVSRLCIYTAVKKYGGRILLLGICLECIHSPEWKFKGVNVMHSSKF